MPAPFIKSIALTILLVVQFEFTDIALSYTENVNIPIEVALFVSLCMLALGIVVYRGSVKRLIEKYQSSDNRRHT